MNADERAAEITAAEAEVDLPEAGSRERYDALMAVVRNRVTVRRFQADYTMPDEHVALILEAARHAPSGANAQPWHFVVVRDPATKQSIADYFVAEQRFRAKRKMKFPTPDYRGLSTAPGFVVVCADMRWVRAFPGFRDDDDEIARMYRANAERILLQSVAAATMSAHLAAAALGYCVWWVTAIGQDDAQAAMRPLLGIPEELSVLDIFLFGPAEARPYKRWRREAAEIVHDERFDTRRLMSDDELADWIATRRHRVMFRDARQVD